MDGKDPQAVTAEARQICLDGLAHGKRYEVQVREGLPSAVGEKLLEDGRACRLRHAIAPPSVRVPRAAATCCPTGASRASRSSPSTPTPIKVEVYRIGDRSLAQTLQGGDFAKPDLLLRHRHLQGAHRRARLCRRAGGGRAASTRT